jgi:hypothetical protein
LAITTAACVASVGHEHAFPWVRDDQRADDDAVRAERHGGGRRGLHVAGDQRRLGTGVAHQLEVLARRGAGGEPPIVLGDRLAAQGGQRAFRRHDTQRIGRAVAHEGQEGALGVEEARGVARHLLHDAVQLQGVGQDVRQLLQGKELGQPAVELLGAAATFLFRARQPRMEAPHRPRQAERERGQTDYQHEGQRSDTHVAQRLSMSGQYNNST